MTNDTETAMDIEVPAGSGSTGAHEPPAAESSAAAPTGEAGKGPEPPAKKRRTENGGSADGASAPADGAAGPNPRRRGSPPPWPPAALRPDIELFGWAPDPALPFDDNLVTLSLLVCRSSLSRRGHMGAIVVRPPAETSPGHAPPDILVMANNVPVYPPANNKKGQSAVEIHAEANAVALCAQRGIGTQGAWIYISFPPCKDCFMSVLYAGIKRVVFRNRMMHEDVKATAKAWGVELVEFDRERDMACNQLSREIANKWKEERNVATGGQQEGAGAEAAEEADADAAGQEANGEAP